MRELSYLSKLQAMNNTHIINELNRNKEVFHSLLYGIPEEQHRWKPEEKKWCLLEVVCHLYDEEREDFRMRVKQVLEDPETEPPPIDPEGWVQSRKYMQQDYEERLKMFLDERERSVEWLRSLQSPKWNNAWKHPKYGPLSAQMFLTNWLAHDYLHIRQITRLKYQYLKAFSTVTLRYAGDW